MFKETSEGQTHSYNDGCGEPAHNDTKNMTAKQKPKILWKSLPANRAPNGHKFELGKWYKESDIEICKKGFHASKNIIDAMGYVNAGYIAKVEVRGESQIQNDKECWSEMRIIAWKKWTKEDSVSLAIYAAELVLDKFEKKYPDNKRPRKAIEAAKNWLENPTKKNRLKAEAAAAAEAAWAETRKGVKDKCHDFVIQRTGL